MKVNRANLKAGNILLLVAWLMLSPKQTHGFGAGVFLELAFYEEGAQLPLALANKLTPDIKMELGNRLSEARNTQDRLASILRMVGLDHELLCDVAEYREFYTMCSNHLQTLFSRTVLLTPVWVNEKGPARRLRPAASAKVFDSLMTFFGEHRHVINALQEAMGHDKVTAILQSLDVEHLQLAQHMALYSHSFTGRLFKPCATCGLPTPGPYPCPCKRPLLAPPAPFYDEAALEPSVRKTPVESYSSRRRGKNLQTAFVPPVATRRRGKQASTASCSI